MLLKNTLVRIKNERGFGWNEEGYMDKYMGLFALINHSQEGFVRESHWYSLSAIPKTIEEDETGYTLDYWKWKVDDFVETETHCSHCGKKITEEELQDLAPNIRRNSVLCKECAETGYSNRINSIDFYKTLVTTSTLLTEEEKNKTLDGFKNVEICVHCGEPILNDLSGRDVNGKPVCYNCRGFYYYCENCNVYVLRGEHFTGANGGIYCSADCVEQSEPYDFTMELAYNAKPPLKFLGSDKKNALFMGVEVEVDGGEMKDDCIYNLSKITQDVYCKHDGSLNYGFEFVTHPATLNYHKNVLKYDKLIEECQNFSFKSHDVETTGLHIHVNRKFFSTPEKAKECALKLEILMERFWCKMLTFARRNETRAERWAKRRQFLSTDYYNTLNAGDIQYFINEMTYDRYTAINTTNSNTIEFRLFKGTLRKQTIFATLEFVDLLCRYVKNASFDDVKKITWDELLEPINKNKYKELKEYMGIMGLLSSPMVA